MVPRSVRFDVRSRKLSNVGQSLYGLLEIRLLNSETMNRPTKRGKKKSPSDEHCQCQKDMDVHLLVCQHFLTETHIVTRLANE
jgi:hypothetical protein